MLKINLGDPKVMDAAIRSVSKFTGKQYDLKSTQWIHLESIDDGIKLTATDLHTSVEYCVNSSEVLQDGEFCIKPKNLLGFGKLIKDQSGVRLDQTEKGVSVSLADAPAFRATYKVLPSDEFPMLPDDSDDAVEVHLTYEQVNLMKSLVKSVSKQKYCAEGMDAVQFATHEKRLYAYAYNGGTIAYTVISDDSDVDNFAIPADTLKKALQVSNTPELRKLDWRITVASDDTDIVSIHIGNTRIRSKQGCSVDLTDLITGIKGSQNLMNARIAFNPKELSSVIKRGSKVIVKDQNAANLLVFASDAGTVNLTFQPMRPSGGGSVSFANRFDMLSEFQHTFDRGKAEIISHNTFQVALDAIDFQEHLKSLIAEKPAMVIMDVKYNLPNGSDDAVILRTLDKSLHYISMTANKVYQKASKR